MSHSPHIFGTTRASDGDFHVRDLSEERVADFVESRHGQRPKAVVWVEQIHSTGHYFVEAKQHRMLGRGDALAADQPGICLTVRTADCVPIFLLGEQAVALLHGGMAGTVQGILPHVAHEFALRYHEDLSKASLHLGPHLCAKCYRMSENNLRYLRGFPAAEAFLSEQDGEKFFSLEMMLRDQGQRIGVSNITVDEGCTQHDDDYFSSRKGHDHRLLSYVMRNA